MKYFSGFTGIAGFEIAMPKNWECVGYCEILEPAIKIINKHFPNHKNYGNITKINTAEIEGIYTTKQYDDLCKMKQGMWQCALGQWHKKGFENCHCAAQQMRKMREEQQKSRESPVLPTKEEAAANQERILQTMEEGALKGSDIFIHMFCEGKRKMRRKTIEAWEKEKISKTCKDKGVGKWMINKTKENGNNWKGGKNKCIDCGKQLPGYTAQRCRSCNGKNKIGTSNNFYIERFSVALRKW